ncbi:hypothetical protein ColTof4_06247 [Colletotrichum tofieldiae]|nr:hypothetical protein ColTof3_01434 [Colletotrichum tofieldiae]GKT73824.1 hypothetical protein ColTof4_06247 [Colletotrichum tofieldiae]GKT95791.1 hypothetical protein Ct61P_13641 [Colletotrichum tofieldiae]
MPISKPAKVLRFGYATALLCIIASVNPNVEIGGAIITAQGVQHIGFTSRGPQLAPAMGA